MGDHPSRKPRAGVEMTDLIFSGPLKYVNFLEVIIKYRTMNVIFVQGSFARRNLLSNHETID